MPAFPFDIVVFDLDGTLADTAPDIAAALNQALARFDRPPLALETVTTLIGGGGKSLLRKALEAAGAAPSDATVDAAYDYYIDRYADRVRVETRAYPGVEAALDDLAARGVRLAICTNKAARTTERLLSSFGWTKRFAAIVDADSLPYRKPDPRILVETVALAGGGRAASVGDSITDARTARAAGLPFVAVSFGYPGAPIGELRPDAMIDHFDELVPALQRL